MHRQTLGSQGAARKTGGRRSAFRAASSAFVFLAVLAALVLAPGCDRLFPAQKDGKAAEKKAPPPVSVLAATAIQKTVPLELKNFGNVEPNLTAAVKAQVTGILTDIAFKEGQDVKAGDRLFTIDPAPFKAALVQADANAARDKVQYDNAIKEVDRQSELLKSHVAAQSDYDTAKAAADSLLATRLADEAMINMAKINLAYCTITSPIDARAGAWQVDQGNLVKANDQTLVVLNQVRPIQLSFSLPQRELNRVKTQAAAEQAAARNLQVKAIIPGQEDKPEIGALTFIDNAVDRTTGMFQLKATFLNSEERLWPGRFVVAVLVLQEEPDCVIIPTRAIQTGQNDRQFVYVIGPDRKVRNQSVTVGRTINDDTIIAAGIKAGETVVTDGQLKLVPGAEVVIKESLETAAGPPKAEAAGPPKSGGKGDEAPRKGAKGDGATKPAAKAAETPMPDAGPAEAPKP